MHVLWKGESGSAVVVAKHKSRHFKKYKKMKSLEKLPPQKYIQNLVCLSTPEPLACVHL